MTYPPPQDPWQQPSDPPTQQLPVLPPYGQPASTMPAPGAHGAPTDGRKPVSRGRKVLIGFLGLVVLCCCGGGIVATLTDSGDDRPAATATTARGQLVEESSSAAEPDVPSPSPLVPTRTASPSPQPSPTRTGPRPTPTRSSPKPTPKLTTGAPRTTEPAEPIVRTGVRPGAFCKPAGALGRTSSGKLMVCRTTSSDNRLRWRAPL
ncbi:hypothetical protein M8C17_18505 [Micromonospora sp. RHAY321]|uniref:hypothetical protein n=1 Tax=Micromonospora sp. RHAY321 TaxID=2944807 RepID=UPI00207CD04D|nr:hypothetical protein [Micromonospora sp. RHAY321]MCO1597150.1 hypothetical protein [Micromonospora sp. RHAY321]